MTKICGKLLDLTRSNCTIRLKKGLNDDMFFKVENLNEYFEGVAVHVSGK